MVFKIKPQSIEELWYDNIGPSTTLFLMDMLALECFLGQREFLQHYPPCFVSKYLGNLKYGIESNGQEICRLVGVIIDHCSKSFDKKKD